MPIQDKVLIWSYEYDRDRAEEICAKANIARPDDSPHEEIWTV